MFLVINLVVQIMDMAYPYHQYSGALVVLWNASSTTTLLLHALHSRRAACVVRYEYTKTYIVPRYLSHPVDGWSWVGRCEVMVSNQTPYTPQPQLVAVSTGVCAYAYAPLSYCT